MSVCRLLNPVRAGLVRSAREWAWSSYRATAGQAASASWLTTAWVLGHFGRTRKGAEAAYQEFVSEGRGQESIWAHLQHQVFLGSEGFITRMQKRITAHQDLSEVPRDSGGRLGNR